MAISAGADEEETGFAVWIAEGQLAGSHHRKNGEGRLEYFRQRPFLCTVCGRRRSGNPDDSSARNQPICRAWVSRLRYHGLRLDPGERIEGVRSRGISVQQSETAADAL